MKTKKQEQEKRASLRAMLRSAKLINKTVGIPAVGIGERLKGRKHDSWYLYIHVKKLDLMVDAIQLINAIKKARLSDMIESQKENIKFHSRSLRNAGKKNR